MLWELQAVSGLPIFGQHYDECIPPDETLFQRQPSADGNKRGELILSAVLSEIQDHYRRTHRAARLSMHTRSILLVDVWIRSFLREEHLTRPTVALHDPFELGVEYADDLTGELAEPFVEIGYMSPALPGIDEDLFLTGFLATWLCIFVLTFKEGAIRYSALLAASHISRGERVSLAPVVLNRVFKILRGISESRSLDVRDQILPWQYLHAWVHIHVRGAFGCLEYPPYFSDNNFPMICNYYDHRLHLSEKEYDYFFMCRTLLGTGSA